MLSFCDVFVDFFVCHRAQITASIMQAWLCGKPRVLQGVGGERRHNEKRVVGRMQQQLFLTEQPILHSPAFRPDRCFLLADSYNAFEPLVVR